MHTRGPKNLTQLHQFCQEEWVKIPANYCEKHVERYPKLLSKEKQFQGHPIKHQGSVFKIFF